MTNVFISYVRENQRKVDRLCESLRAAGVQIWLDREQIKPGQRWQRVIREAIRSGTHFIACFSRQYREREESYMNEELLLALDELRRKPAERTWFIPVLLSRCKLPDPPLGGGESLKDIQWVSLYSNWEKGISRLIEALGVRCDDSQIETPTGNPLLDAAWESYISGTDERRLYLLGEAAGLGHPKVKSELLRLPVNEHCLSIAKLAPFPEYVPIAIRELTTTYDESCYSACDFLSAASERIANDIKEKHLVPAVATAALLAEIHDDNEMASSFGALVWFISSIGKKNPDITDACLHILRRIAELDLDDWHRNEVTEALNRIEGGEKKGRGQ